MVTASQMAGLIGNLQNQLNEYGVAEQYADRVNVLLQKKADAAQKVADCQAAIAATTDYLERLTAAKNAKTEVYAILEEINTEIEAILAEAKQSEGGQQAINKQAYDRLSAEIDDIQTTYDLVYNEYIALAQINGSGWAASFGNRLGGIQSGINAMKATLGGLYAQGTLTEETTLASIYEQYETIVGDLNVLKAQFEQTIAGQVNQILYDLNMVTASQMAGLIGNLQNQLNEWGVAEKYADRVNVLLQKKADAAQKVADCQMAIAATTDYVERLTAAKNAKTEVYTILEEINTEIEAILAEANPATGITAIKARQFTNKQIYNMSGVRVNTPGKGLYIINGKKVIIK